MNIVSFRHAPRIETPIVVVRLQFQSLSHPLPATGNYGQSAGMFFIRSSGRFLRQGTRRILNLFRAQLQSLQESSRRAADGLHALHSLLTHAVNHNDEDRRDVVREGQGRVHE